MNILNQSKVKSIN